MSAPQAEAGAPAILAGAVSGQGAWRFRVHYTSAHLPRQALPFLDSAHGGFAVDLRPGRGETYFALPGAGVIRISGDLKTVVPLSTPASMKATNLHNTTLWYDRDGTPYLTFPANDSGQVFTTTLDGQLLHTLETPVPTDDFDQPEVNEYFRKGGKFAPTDVEFLDGLFYITTGYSSLDYVLTAQVVSFRPFRALWHDLSFGGRGNGPGRFGTGHGITVPPGSRRLEISDRPNSRISRFTRYGQFRSDVPLPAGAFPCDIYYLDRYAVVGCLYGPDRSKGAPIYILENDQVVSTIMPKEDLGLVRFQHVHNAVLRKSGGRYYIIAQAWNPGDFVILEQLSQ
jgi:hypothetical protein